MSNFKAGSQWKVIEEVLDDNNKFFNQVAPNIILEILEIVETNTVKVKISEIHPENEEIFDEELTLTFHYQNSYPYLSFNFIDKSYHVLAIQDNEIANKYLVCDAVNSLLKSLCNHPQLCILKDLDINVLDLDTFPKNKSEVHSSLFPLIDKIRGFVAFLINTKLDIEKIKSYSLSPKDFNHLSLSTLNHFYKVDMKYYQKSFSQFS